MIPNLLTYDWIVVNSSAGKDSQAMLDYVVEQADLVGFKRERIVVAHAELRKEEWSGTVELCRKQAEHYGLKVYVMARRKADGSGDTILEYAERRKMWPSSGQRWCTSDFKRGPVGRLFTQLGGGAILNCLGMRAQESPTRAKLPEFEENKRYTNDSRCVDNWLPIHSWTLEQVWARIKTSGVPHHYAYDLGMPRLSCCFCIFAPRAALLLAGKHNRALLEEYVATERKIGHSFRDGFKIETILQALDAGEEPAKVADWKM